MMFSIVVPAYNMAHYIADCLASVSKAMKGYETSAELIIVDDGSSDGTHTLAANFKKKAKFPVHVVKHPSNRGLSAARNSGVQKAAGDYVLLLDADNRLDPGALARLEKEISSDKETDVFILGMRLIDEAGKRIGEFYGDMVKEDVSAVGVNKSMRLLQENFMDAFALVKRSLLLDHPYDENFRYFEDWDLWIRLSWIKDASFKFISEHLGEYRIVQSSLIHELRKDERKNKRQFIRVYSKVILNSEAMGLPPEATWQITQHVRNLCQSLI
jgi:glycosyltransferase involved in cell wall biosynthesis